MHVPAVARLMQTLTQLRAHGSRNALHHSGVRKDSSGYGVAAALADDGHLIDLLVGSEGTLCLFVAAELSLCAVPPATATALAAFPSLEHATECAGVVRDDGASACELLDRTFLDVAATNGDTGISLSAEAVLLIEVEGETAAAAAAAVAQVAERCRAHGAFDVRTALTADDEHALWELRHAASPILARLAPRLQSMQFIEDGCVPADQFPSYVRGVRNALRRFDTTGVIFGHAGDAHAHVNPLLDITRADWRDRVYGILDEVTALVARLGGTVSGEHGDGRLRVSLLPRVWSPEALAAFANVKSAGDPAGVFNVGCKIAQADSDTDPAASSHPAAVWRYDPDAPAIDARARAALDRIERSRTWQQFRLDPTLTA